MKTIVLVRHAKSDWSIAGQSDFDRKLNERGNEDAPLMAAHLKKQGYEIEKIVTSPAVRAKSTAFHFAGVFGLNPETLTEIPKLYEPTTEGILDEITYLDDSFDTIALFSHNPAITYVISHFTEDYISNVGTCGIGVVQADVDQWLEFNQMTAQLKALFLPKMVLSKYA